MSTERPLVEGEDFYREGAAMVFTARYHLRRGYCCANNCRHCPYTDKVATASPREEGTNDATHEADL